MFQTSAFRRHFTYDEEIGHVGCALWQHTRNCDWCPGQPRYIDTATAWLPSTTHLPPTLQPSETKPILR